MKNLDFPTLILLRRGVDVSSYYELTVEVKEGWAQRAPTALLSGRHDTRPSVDWTQQVSGEFLPAVRFWLLPVLIEALQITICVVFRREIYTGVGEKPSPFHVPLWPGVADRFVSPSKSPRRLEK